MLLVLDSAQCLDELGILTEKTLAESAHEVGQTACGPSRQDFGPSALQSFGPVKFPRRLANATRLVAGLSRRLRMTCFGLP